MHFHFHILQFLLRFRHRHCYHHRLRALANGGFSKCIAIVFLLSPPQEFWFWFELGTIFQVHSSNRWRLIYFKPKKEQQKIRKKGKVNQQQQEKQ